MNNSFNPFKNNEVSNLDYVNDLKKQGKVKEAKKYALSILYGNIGITKQVDQIGLIELLKKYSIDEIVDYVSFQGLIQTLEAFYEIDNLDFGIEENKSSINNIISNKSGFVKIKNKSNIKDQSINKKHFFVKERPNYEKEVSQYFCSIKDITNLDQIDIDKLKKYLSYSSKCDSVVVISQSFYLFGKIGNKIDEGNKKNNTIYGELLNLKNNYITNDNFIYTIDKIISSPDCDTQGIGNVFYGMQCSKIDINKELLKRVLNKLISLPNQDSQGIGNMFYSFKNSIVDIDKETLEKVINKLISSPDCDTQGIGNMFYGLKNSKINISNETLEKVINRLILLDDQNLQGISNMFYGLKNSKVDIGKEILEKIINKHIGTIDCNAQSIGNMFYGFKNSIVNIDKKTLEKVINKLISLSDCNEQSIGNVFYGLKNSKIDINKELLKRVINKLISLPNQDSQGIGNMFYGLKNSIVDIDKETLEKVTNKLISLPNCNEQSIGNTFYGLKNSKVEINEKLLKKVINKFFGLQNFSEQGVFNIFFGLQNSKLEISQEVIELIKTHFSYETFLPLFKRLDVEQFNNLLDLKGIFPEKYQIELELIKFYKEEKYTEGLKFFEGIKEEYAKEFVDHKIKYLRKLKKYDEVIEKYGKSIDSLNIDSQIEIAYVLFNNNKGKEAIKIFGELINKKISKIGRITRLYTGIIFCLSKNINLMDDFGKNLFEIALNKLLKIDLDKLTEDEVKHIKKAIYNAKNIPLY